MSKLTHTDEKGKASMVDVGHKAIVSRTATAEGIIFLQKETIALIRDNEIKKGDVLTVAEIAGIQAAKRTADLIPLCHPLLLHVIKVTTTLTNEGVTVSSTVSCHGNTGVEMEALTAVQIALLTIYDMCKAVDKSMVMSHIRLLSKSKTALPEP